MKNLLSQSDQSKSPHLKFSYFLIILLLSTYYVSYAQITITESQFESILLPGETHQFTNSDSTTLSVNIGHMEGPNVYDFSNVSLPPLETSNNYYVKDIPILASRYPKDAVVIGTSEDDIENNPVFIFGNDTVYVAGIATTYPQQNYKHYQPFEIAGIFPLTYNANYSFTSTIYDTTYGISGEVLSADVATGINNAKIDGFGTLKILGKEYQCLRMKLDHTTFGDKEFMYFTREGVFVDVICNGAEPDTGTVNIFGMRVLKANTPVSVDKGKTANNNFFLNQNYPNPFNPTTNIKFDIIKLSAVSLRVYDILGREVATLVNGSKPAGLYEIKFDATNLTSGIYFYTLRTDGFIQTKKMLLMK